MNTYPQRVAENILPLSTSNNVSEAFKEWYFTDNVKDHETNSECCELCDQEQLRYHFEIRNKHTSEILQVGSSCILKFQVDVYENGYVLDEKSSKQKLEKIKRNMRLESCVNALEKLAISESNDILENALKFYRTNEYLTPKYAFVVLWRLSMSEIDYNPSFFKVSLKKDQYKRDLKLMPRSRVHLIWGALSSSQRKKAIEYGHSAPEIGKN